MERIDPPLIADAILTAPGWARVALTCRSPAKREEAARELAEHIACALSLPTATGADEGQACLPL